MATLLAHSNVESYIILQWEEWSSLTDLLTGSARLLAGSRHLRQTETFTMTNPEESTHLFEPATVIPRVLSASDLRQAGISSLNRNPIGRVWIRTMEWMKGGCHPSP
ncbi:Hypothetical predicted protein [Podarcis lilfordi]|uniref:Uncharacterized protein n=1 Tax=Podarcis lilfordi TaxID=74358 RepID=A0AA35JSS1_9SAUR|nr:Hypothetical predicted protein [Podarcis lilfordi]